MGLKHKIAIATAVLGALFAILSAVAGSTLLGHEARLVDIIGLFAGGFGAGAGLTAALIAARVAANRQRAGDLAEGGTQSGEIWHSN